MAYVLPFGRHKNQPLEAVPADYLAVRAECASCRAFLTYLPAVEPYTTMADRNASPTAILDVLTRMDELGIPLHSDGAAVSVPWPHSRRVPADLTALLLVRVPGPQAGRRLAAWLKRGLRDHSIPVEDNRDLGAEQIDAHLKKAARHTGPYDDLQDVKVHVQWPSLAAGQRYQGVLYIEKEGFAPMLEEARVAERFDLAVISCKGQSVVAARRFVDTVCARGRGVPLFVVHDLDKAGFEISQRLTRVSDWARQNDRVTYEFQNDIDVIDLGLRLADVEEYGLEDLAEECEFKGGFASDSIATEEEREFLLSGRRVELDAFTAPEFIEWLEAKLGEHLPDRLIPDDDVLADAYRRAVAAAKINKAIAEVRVAAIEEARSTEVPESLRSQLEEAMEDGEGAWDQALYDLVADADGPEAAGGGESPPDAG
jgi:hypothetical protein